MIRQAADWEKIFAENISDKEQNIQRTLKTLHSNKQAKKLN